MSPLFTFKPEEGTAAEFHEPYGMAYWPDADGGRLLIADALNNRVEAYRPNLGGLTLDHLFTIEGFTIQQFDTAHPYALAIDPQSGRIAATDTSHIANRSWILQTRNLVAYDFEVVDQNGDAIESVCSGDPYEVHFSLTVPVDRPALTGVEPTLTIGGNAVDAPTGLVDLAPRQAYRYVYPLVAPGSPLEPFVGELALVAGGTASEPLDPQDDLLTRRGLVAISDCSGDDRPSIRVSAVSAPPQASGWTRVSAPLSTTPFVITLEATDDSAVRQIVYEFVQGSANDHGFVIPPVFDSTAQVVLTELGVTTIRFRAQDDNLRWSDWETHTVKLVLVEQVNAAPSFTPGPNQIVAEDAVAQTVSGWATAISTGPANESAQTATLIVANNHSALFSVQPAVSASGTLTYRPAPDAFGTAVVSVQMRDDGGIDYGGDDTSDAHEFTITVTPVNDPPSANGESYSVTEGTTLVVPAPGVLGNDQDIDSPSLTAGVLSGPSTGTLQLNANGSFTYSAPAGVTGSVTFTYRASDGSSSSEATVTIGVAPSNVPPICTAASTNVDLWPANHKEVYVAVGGVVDPEGRPVSITFTSIVQDEPTNSVGQGNTMQDGAITNGGARAWVRAERAGSHKVPGDGRVYLIGFLATDAGGLTCTGTVRVDVPHDQRGKRAVLSPGRWNSITGQKLP